MNEATKSDTKITKKAFLDAYSKTFGNITQSCNAIGIHRSTYYKWLKADKDFVNQLNEIEPEERFMDFLESKLVQKINGGDTASIIFALKTKAKPRGYVERQEIEHSSNLETDITFEVHKREKETKS
jgi:hypothetical protein